MKEIKARCNLGNSPFNTEKREPAILAAISVSISLVISR